MKAKQTTSKSSLFLIELIIAIVFFALASAICTQLFVKAHLMSVRSLDLSTALGIAQNTAERYRSLNRDGVNTLFGAEGNSTLPPDITVREFYDSKGQVVEEGSETFTYRMEMLLSSAQAPLFHAQIAVYKIARDAPPQTGEALCAITVNHYTG